MKVCQKSYNSHKSFQMESPQTIGNYLLGQTLGIGTTGKVKLAERIDTKHGR